MRRGEAIVLGLFCGGVLVETIRRDLQPFSGGEARYEERLPEDAPTQSLEAVQAYNQGNQNWDDDIRGAIGLYSEALELDPDFDEARANRALARALTGDEEEAFDDLAKLRAAGSDVADSLELQLRQALAGRYAMEGQSALQDGDPHWAIDRFTQALMHADDDPVILTLRAAAYAHSGRQAEAAADEQRAQAARADGTASVLMETDER